MKYYYEILSSQDLTDVKANSKEIGKSYNSYGDALDKGELELIRMRLDYPYYAKVIQESDSIL